MDEKIIKIMEKEFVTYEIALKLEELGFDKPCFGHFANKLSWQIDCQEGSLYINPSLKGSEYTILAPLWQQAIDFLEEKNIVVEILPKEDGKYSVAYYHKDMSLEEIYEFFHNAEVVQYTLYNTKIKAREAAILKAIELCQK